MSDKRSAPAQQEANLIVALRRGDQQAFRHLFARENGALLGFARGFLRDAGAAEEAVQDTWIAVLKGLEAFEERSSLKSWMFSILANIARSKAKRDGRSLSFTEMGFNDAGVDPDRFSGDGTWLSPPGRWSEINPERILGGRQLLDHALAVLETLPANQRAVVQLRDIEGLSADDACAILSVSAANQRILLHRGRARVRAAIAALLEDDEAKA